jgi:glucan phosphoethanolaminetransferase (alkaline phosphatase superfamily)
MMTFENLGFESVLFFYPFIKNGATSQKWGQYGVLFSTFLYLCTALVSFAYFSQGQLAHTIWPTLTMAKIIEIPFLQRFEYILIALWLLVVLPTIAVSVWCTIRGFSKTFNKPPTIFLILALIALLVFSIFFDDRETIDQLNTRLSMTGFYFIYGYIPFLFLYSLIRAKIKQKKTQKEEREPTLS